MNFFNKITPEKVSPTMVKSVFHELRANGYSHGQIISLSKELGRMVDEESISSQPTPGLGTMTFEIDLSGMAWVS